VLGSALAISAARAISWIIKTRHETLYYGSAVDALEFLIAKGESVGLRVPEEARTLAADLDHCARFGRDPTTLVSST
jgi:hypothetical protein